ncbi:MAG TPA: NAD(P)-dependent oxidoreductase [Mycobacteriales bacterium]|nr:NAD(P)-dependent oxidoreductase [Mycobacteriales bacterium]
MSDDTSLTIAVLGTGIMGAPMARNLAKAGFDVRAWNRTIDKAQPLAADGVTVCTSARDAAAGADVVITMLANVDAVASVVEGDEGPFTDDESPIWLQMSTVGLEGNEKLASYAAERGIRYVDAPVLGTKQPAEEGALTVLASGDDELKDRVQPVFDAVGSRTMWLGKAGQGTRLKLVVNSWVLALTSATAEALALADGLGVDPTLFLDTIDGGPLDVKYAHVKGGAMLRGEFPPAFPVEGAAKDARLIVEAAAAVGVHARVADAVATHMKNAAEAGHGRDDMAAVWTVVSR